MKRKTKRATLASVTLDPLALKPPRRKRARFDKPTAQQLEREGKILERLAGAEYCFTRLAALVDKYGRSWRAHAQMRFGDEAIDLAAGIAISFTASAYRARKTGHR